MVDSTREDDFYGEWKTGLFPTKFQSCSYVVNFDNFP